MAVAIEMLSIRCEDLSSMSTVIGVSIAWP
jgi:hypothetical protein